MILSDPSRPSELMLSKGLDRIWVRASSLPLDAKGPTNVRSMLYDAS
jgi:hypothetical protein